MGLRVSVVELMPVAEDPDDDLARCAARVHDAYQRSLDARADSVEAHFEVGRALLDARKAQPSNQAFGLWFRNQKFGFSRNWALVLRWAAEFEPQVRKALHSRLGNGKPSIEEAVRTVRRQLAQGEVEPQAATVTSIASRRPDAELTEQIRDFARLGIPCSAISEAIGVNEKLIYRLAKAAGIGVGKKSRLAMADRIDRMKRLASEGATSQQIADELGVAWETVRIYRKKHDIAIPADATTVVRTMSSTRIVTATIDALDGIDAMFGHIDYPALPPEDIKDWVNVLDSSIRSLTTLRKRLKELTQ